jgi:hypothetical protein
LLTCSLVWRDNEPYEKRRLIGFQHERPANSMSAR